MSDWIMDHLPLTNRFELNFWDKVRNTPSCWEWAGAKSKSGYGRINLQSHNVLAHRVSWVISGNSLHEGLVIDHLCENRLCVNPAHLAETTNAENVRNGKFRSNNTSGLRGVYWNKASNKWEARLGYTEGWKSRKIYLGLYDDPKLASEAIRNYWLQHNPLCRNLNRLKVDAA